MTAVLTKDTLTGHGRRDTQPATARQGTPSDDGQSNCDTQLPHAVVGATSPQASESTAPISPPPAGAELPDPANGYAAPAVATLVREQTTDSGQTSSDTHRLAATVGSNSGTGQPAKRAATTTLGSLADPSLALAADIVDDLERVRIAEENRLRSLTDPERFGLDETHPDVARLAAIVQALAKVEHEAVLNLQRTVRKHPLGEWAKAQKGVGEKTIARLLATMGGDPYVNLATGEIRTVSQLWALCGHGDPTRRMRKGMSQADLFACGSPIAKKRVWLIATSCLKAGGPYADAYRTRREVTAERTHAAPCVRCGPSGKPALEGSPWSSAHQHADALRIVGKAVLRDMWLEAKRIHEATA